MRIRMGTYQIGGYLLKGGNPDVASRSNRQSYVYTDYFRNIGELGAHLLDAYGVSKYEGMTPD